MVEEACSFFSFITMILSVIEYDLEFKESDEQTAKYMLWLMMLSCIIQSFLTILRYHAKLDYYKECKVISRKENLLSSG